MSDTGIFKILLELDASGISTGAATASLKGVEAQLKSEMSKVGEKAGEELGKGVQKGASKSTSHGKSSVVSGAEAELKSLQAIFNEASKLRQLGHIESADRMYKSVSASLGDLTKKYEGVESAQSKFWKGTEALNRSLKAQGSAAFEPSVLYPGQASQTLTTRDLFSRKVLPHMAEALDVMASPANFLHSMVKVAEWTAATTVIFTIIGALAAMGKAALDTNRYMADLSETMDNLKQATEFGGAASVFATRTGRGLSSRESFTPIAKGIEDETLRVEAMSAATLMLRTTNVDATSSVEGLVRAYQQGVIGKGGFNEFVDIINTMSDKTVANVNDLATALAMVNKQATNLGISRGTITGLMVSGSEITGKSVQQQAPMMQQMMANIVSPNAVKALKSAGITSELGDTNGLLKQLVSSWGSLNAAEQTAIASTLVNKKSRGELIAVLNNEKRTLELVKMANTSAGSSGLDVQRDFYNISTQATDLGAKLSGAFAMAVKPEAEFIAGLLGSLNGAIDLAAELGTKINAIGRRSVTIDQNTSDDFGRPDVYMEKYGLLSGMTKMFFDPVSRANAIRQFSEADREKASGGVMSRELSALARGSEFEQYMSDLSKAQTSRINKKGYQISYTDLSQWIETFDKDIQTAQEYQDKLRQIAEMRGKVESSKSGSFKGAGKDIALQQLGVMSDELMGPYIDILQLKERAGRFGTPGTDKSKQGLLKELEQLHPTSEKAILSLDALKLSLSDVAEAATFASTQTRLQNSRQLGFINSKQYLASLQGIPTDTPEDAMAKALAVQAEKLSQSHRKFELASERARSTAAELAARKTLVEEAYKLTGDAVQRDIDMAKLARDTYLNKINQIQEQFESATAGMWDPGKISNMAVVNAQRQLDQLKASGAKQEEIINAQQELDRTKLNNAQYNFQLEQRRIDHEIAMASSDAEKKKELNDAIKETQALIEQEKSAGAGQEELWDLEEKIKGYQDAIKALDEQSTSTENFTYNLPKSLIEPSTLNANLMTGAYNQQPAIGVQDNKTVHIYIDADTPEGQAAVNIALTNNLGTDMNVFTYAGVGGLPV